MRFYKGKVGKNAYKVSKVWKLGPHIFVNADELTLRLCYWRNDNGTYYVELSIKIKDQLECSCS